MDKQGKHIEGHNSWKTLTDQERARKSVLTHKDPEKLLQRNAGKGIPVKGGDPHEVGYKEACEFTETIGIWKSKDGKIAKSTTRGTIHYDTKGGAHIVPIEPNE